jgi:hypothetical protein
MAALLRRRTAAAVAATSLAPGSSGTRSASTAPFAGDSPGRRPMLLLAARHAARLRRCSPFVEHTVVLACAPAELVVSPSAQSARRAGSIPSVSAPGAQFLARPSRIASEFERTCVPLWAESATTPTPRSIRRRRKAMIGSRRRAGIGEAQVSYGRGLAFFALRPAPRARSGLGVLRLERTRTGSTAPASASPVVSHRYLAANARTGDRSHRRPERPLLNRRHREVHVRRAQSRAPFVGVDLDAGTDTLDSDCAFDARGRPQGGPWVEKAPNIERLFKDSLPASRLA